MLYPLLILQLSQALAMEAAGQILAAMEAHEVQLGWIGMIPATSCLLYHENHCIGLRGNLEQTMVFTYFYMLCLNHIYIYKKYIQIGVPAGFPLNQFWERTYR
jgi:hypothetical protein